MKVAIYYPWVYLTSGVERVILEILKKSKHDYTVFTNHYDKKNTYPGFEKFRVVELKRASVKRDIYSVFKAASTISRQKIDLNGFDALMVHSEGLGDLILLRNSDIPTICYCYTPLRPVFDEDYRKHALKRRDFFSRLVFYVFSFLFKNLDKALWKKYDYILFSSNETKRRAGRGQLLDGRKHNIIKVLSPGTDNKKKNKVDIFKPYFLIPGRIMWTKNIQLAMRAFIKLKEKNPDLSDFRLVIAGQVDRKSREYLKKLRKISKDRVDVDFIASPTDRKLDKLYSECWAVFQSSFNEDWGLTLLEGNAFGKPVVAVDKGGPKETQINGKTGFLVDNDIDAYAKAMEKLARDEALARKMGKNARKNALKYDVSDFVKRIDKVIEQVS